VYVAPYTGAWIETKATPRMLYSCAVAPYTGAWIETHLQDEDGDTIRVAPYTGAWIETDYDAEQERIRRGRSLHGSVD